ncbi:ribonuclease H-like domain-containing protein [Tanacetum coccineum]
MVTLISKLDVSNPLHLHPNDSSALTVISVKLKGTENYQVWSCAMLLALKEKNKTGFIDGFCKRSNTDEFDALVQLSRCTCHAVDDFKKHNQLMKLMQFLMGLDDSYMQIRSNILSREPFPGVRNACAINSSEESHRVVTSFGYDTSQRNNVPRPQTSGTSVRPANVTRTSDTGNIRPNGGSAMICDHYGFNGHTIERCFKLIGYPTDFGKREFFF